ncbi:Gelsolin [Eumeta japonica]|uniref:Gelsolin n=1 Tax=Eumeta variegata TaxID=151549 RepID=A0A4C1WX25_EUMVA|nr:Gelsolin [Eumeta japonica]
MNFEPVAVPQSDFGKFYKGDSYIVLKTTADKRNNLSWDIHYWLGAQTSQDEAGAAAILTVGLDDKFNGAPVQHREVQGHESSQFLGYFQPVVLEFYSRDRGRDHDKRTDRSMYRSDSFHVHPGIAPGVPGDYMQVLIYYHYTGRCEFKYRKKAQCTLTG